MPYLKKIMFLRIIDHMIFIELLKNWLESLKIVILTVRVKVLRKTYYVSMNKNVCQIFEKQMKRLSNTGLSNTR